MKFKAMLIGLLSLAMIVSSCKEDDPEEAVTYTLTVNNKSSVSADVYIKSDLGTSSFVSHGTVAVNGSVKITKLVMDVTYTVRAVETGNAINQYFAEQPVINTQTDKYDVSIDIIDAP